MAASKSKHCGAALLAASLMVILSSTASAALRWDTRVGISPTISLTDNVCLENGGQKIGWTTAMGLSPSGSIAASTRRSQMSLSGTINMNSLTNSYLKSKGCNGDYKNRSQYNPQLSGLFKTTFGANLLRFNSKVRVRQNEVSSRYAGGTDEFNRTGNSNTYMRYSLTPSVSGKVGTLMNVNSSYTWDEVLNTNDIVRDSNRHRGTLSFRSAWKSDWSHLVSGSISRTEYDKDINGKQRNDTDLSSIKYKLGYHLRNWVTVSVSAGKSFNSYQTFSRNRQDGNSWTADVVLTPRPTTSLTIGLEDRYFGDAPVLALQHRNKFSTYALSYKRRLTFRRDLRTQDDEIFDIFEEDLELLGNASDFSTSPIIDERLTGGWTYNSKKTTLSFSGTLSKQEREEDGQTAEFKSFIISYRPRITSVMNINTSLSWREDQPIQSSILLPSLGDESKSQLWTFAVTGSRSLGRRSTLSLTYRFTDRNGEADTGSYQENRITASVGINF